MNSANYFAGNTGVLLMPSDDEVSRRVTDTIVKPYLASIGITKVQASYIDSSTTGSLGATSSAALIAGRNGKPVRECMAADLPLAVDHFRDLAAERTVAARLGPGFSERRHGAIQRFYQ